MLVVNTVSGLGDKEMEINTNHEVVKGDTILSPMETVLTEVPVSTTSPLNSWPMVTPAVQGSIPRYTWRSLRGELTDLCLAHGVAEKPRTSHRQPQLVHGR